MIAIKLLLLMIFSSSAFTMIDIHMHMKSNPLFMNYVLSSYLPWHEKSFGSRVVSGKHQALVKKILQSLDRWKTPEFPILDQILIGQGFNGNKAFFRYRLYIPKGLRAKNEMFLEWGDEQGACFVSPLSKADLKWKAVPVESDALYFKHRCDDGSEKISLWTTNMFLGWKNPFPGSFRNELRTYSKEKLISIFYTTHDVHISSIPERHYPYINEHGINVLLPLDKYSVDESGNLTIYYP